MLRRSSPYEKAGRLSDVVAAVTVLAAHKNSTKEIDGWVDQLSKAVSETERADEIERWTGVFEDHPEFFLVYVLPGETEKKAALRLRYANKTIDPTTGKEPPDLAAMTSLKRSNLTSLPLSEASVNNLVTAAINLHTAALSRRSDRRFWFTLVAPVLGVASVVLGAAATAYFSKSGDHPVAKLEIKVVAPPGVVATRKD